MSNLGELSFTESVWLYPKYYGKFARQESVNRNFNNCWTMKAAGNRTCIIALRFSDFKSRVASYPDKGMALSLMKFLRILFMR